MLQILEELDTQLPANMSNTKSHTEDKGKHEIYVLVKPKAMLQVIQNQGAQHPSISTLYWYARPPGQILGGETIHVTFFIFKVFR